MRTARQAAREPAAEDGALARRFLAWHGPATVKRFAWWAGVSGADAVATWARLGRELQPVAVDGRARHLLARDETALTGAETAQGVRFLPLGDPYLLHDRAALEAGAAPAPTGDERGEPVTRRLVNSLAGRILVDGRVVGAWGRERERLAIYLWRAGDPARERIVAEAERFAGPIGRPMRLRWLR